MELLVVQNANWIGRTDNLAKRTETHLKEPPRRKETERFESFTYARSEWGRVYI